MSTWIYRLARASWNARRRVVAIWLAVVLALGALAATIGGSFDDGFRIPGASSQKALDQLQMTFPQAAMTSSTMVILAPAGERVDDAAIKEKVEAAGDELTALPWVDSVQTPYNEYVSGMVSDDGVAGMMRVNIKNVTVSEFTDAQRDQLLEAGEHLQDAIPGSTVHVGGEVFSVEMPEITPVEGIGVILAIIVLFLVLGSARAAMMPIVNALIGAAASMLLIVAASGIMPINSTTTMLALMLALAVGIDYSLFIVSRHRDQLATGMDPAESAARATATAGSAVLFAGLTVIIALVGLSVANIPFLTTMGVFAAVAVAIEVALALTLLPAMLGFAGAKLTPKPAKNPDKKKFEASRWWVRVITKFPAVTIAAVVLLLGALTIPAQNLQLALPNSGRNAPTATDRITFDAISEHFGVGYNGPLVVTGSIVESTDPLGLIDAIKTDIEAVRGVKTVAMAVPNPHVDTAMIQVIPTTGPDDPETTELVYRLRALEPQWKAEHNVDMAVTGFTAIAIDVSDQLGAALLPFGIFVVGLSLVLLAVMFRSILVPIKAALGYLLSVGAAFGLTTLVFNEGIGKELVNLHDPQPIISFLPIILMGILFGLAMDYEVFLTSRMREEYVHGNHTNPTEAGFLHSAKVVVAAAVIMIAVFAFFIPSGSTTIKPIAFGLAVGVGIDAFLVRMTLGPAVMKLLHGRAWWLPTWLARRMPVLDAEGEAITHQLSLADWPHPGADHAVYGEGLGASDGDTVLFEDVDLDIPRGGNVEVDGAPGARRALLLALTGRLALTSGDLKVLGMVLPQQAGQVRREALFIDGTDPDADAALTGPAAALVVVDDADRLDGPGREALARLIADPAVTVVSGINAGDDHTIAPGAAPEAAPRDPDHAPAPGAARSVLVGGAA